MSARFAIGIDLGTTNSLLAYTPLEAETADVATLPIPQAVAAGVIESRSALPSFLYLTSDEETGTFDLPWESGAWQVTGEAARLRGAQSPEQVVAGAKSWLAHSLVDRRQPLLPWTVGGAADEANPVATPRKVSPVEASRAYLEHLTRAWEAAFPDVPLAEQVVTLTVPASFDAAARDLTREAALAAGLPADLVLLEEPQAAIYAWLARRGEGWRKELAVGDTLLVCDVGGGTSDFSLVSVADAAGDMELRRIAVGQHLLVGGDNMDLTLAHHAAGLFEEKDITLDPWQSVGLWHACRLAKETLLAAEGPETTTIAVPGRGRRLVGGTVKVEVTRADIRGLLLDGFLPPCSPEERPSGRRGSGFQDIGLPFEKDPAITRHLAAFLARHGAEGQPARPTRLLLNGGVFRAAALTERLQTVLAQWFPDAPPMPLDTAEHLDQAVAQGAAFYGWTTRRGGVRIRGGTGRSYYVGIETAGLAIPGAPRPLRALCVVPFGMEEGTETEVPSAEIGLVVGEPAGFRFFSSSLRKQDKPGDLLARWTAEELAETDSMDATLDRGADAQETYVPVRFRSRITELGVMELWCQSTRDDRQWKLEFSVREDAATPAPPAP